MKIENSIGWCDETGNQVTGCDKVSPGCAHCYAQVGTRARVLRAQGIETWGPKGQRYPVADFSKKVRRLNKLCICDNCHRAWKISEWGDMQNRPPFGLKKCYCGSTVRRIRIFADSNSDWLDDKWPIETLADLLKDIHDCPNIDFQLLTKRPQLFMRRLSLACEWFQNFTKASATGYTVRFILDWVEATKPPANVWLGVSVEDQKRADERIPLLLNIPAKVRFLSVEPLLEKVCLTQSTFPVEQSFRRDIHWVIVGGESGAERRDCGVEAICDVARQCVAAGVPCFVKQASAFKSGQQGAIPDDVWALKQFPHA